MKESLLIWGSILILGFPILSIILGEFSAYLKRKYHPLATFVRNLQRFVLPPLVIVLIVEQILGLTNLGIIWQILQTALWIGIIYTLLSLAKVVLTSEDRQYTWQFAVPNLFFQAIRSAIVLLILGYALTDVWKVDVGEAVQALGVGSLVIALALQDTLSNLVSGFLLLADSPFKKGDWLKVGDMDAQVIDINWRAVRLQTEEGNVVMIPNGNLGKENIFNYNLPNPTRGISEKISFSYDDPPNVVKQVLKQTLLETPGVMIDEPVSVSTLSYDDGAIAYEVSFMVKDYLSGLEVGSDFKTRLYYVAKRHGLNMPFPIHHNYIMDLREEQQEDGKQADIKEYLHSLSYFTSLDAQTIEKLARHSTVEHFGIGELVLRPGDLVRGLYLIQKGNVAVKVKDRTGSDRTVYGLSVDDFFGESVFLSNSSNFVTVEVKNDLEVLRIDRDVAADLLAANTGLAKQVNELIEGRRNAIQQIQEQEDRLVNKPAGNGNFGGRSMPNLLKSPTGER